MDRLPLDNRSFEGGDSPPRPDKTGNSSAGGKVTIRVLWEHEPTADAQERLLAAFEMLFTDTAQGNPENEEERAI